jgi:hypothetical protein
MYALMITKLTPLLYYGLLYMRSFINSVLLFVLYQCIPQHTGCGTLLVAQLFETLRCKPVAVSIPVGVIGIFY